VFVRECALIGFDGQIACLSLFWAKKDASLAKKREQDEKQLKIFDF
jgi:hypothetical protein